MKEKKIDTRSKQVRKIRGKPEGTRV
jgi:hypothetical protein